MIRVGSWPLHGSSYLRSIVNPARALRRAAPAAASAARAGGPARGHPARRATDRTPRVAGLFRGRHARGTAELENRDIPRAARSGNQAAGFQPLAGMSLVTVPSSLARQEPRQRGAVSSRLSPRGLCAACLSLRLGCLAVPSSCAGQFSSDACGTHQDRPRRRARGAIQGAIGGRYGATQGDTPRQLVQLLIEN